MRHLSIALLLFGFVALSSAAGAQDGPNLLAGATFGTAGSLTNWSFEPPVSTSWVRTDAHANPLSGSAKAVLSATDPYEIGLAATQCVTAGSGRYLGRARLWVEGTSRDQAYLAVYFMKGANCSGARLGAASSEAVAASGQWTMVSLLKTAPAGTISISYQVQVLRGAAPSGDLVAYVDDAFLGTGTCAPGPTQACLVNGRFKVTASLAAGSGTYVGQRIGVGDSTSSFWFVDSSLVDLDVRVLNGCGVNGRFWVEAGGLIGPGALTLTVTDTKTTTVKTYSNAAGTTFPVTEDTNAFATCP